MCSVAHLVTLGEKLNVLHGSNELITVLQEQTI
jgi:hypothetical protein